MIKENGVLLHVTNEDVKLLKENMENALKLTVPLTVGISYGRNWYDAK